MVCSFDCSETTTLSRKWSIPPLGSKVSLARWQVYVRSCPNGVALELLRSYPLAQILGCCCVKCLLLKEIVDNFFIHYQCLDSDKVAATSLLPNLLSLCLPPYSTLYSSYRERGTRVRVPSATLRSNSTLCPFATGDIESHVLRVAPIHRGSSLRALWAPGMRMR